MLDQTRRFFLAALPVAAFVILTASGAGASDMGLTRAKVPFAFELNGRHFDAGIYTLRAQWGSGIITLVPEQGSMHYFLGSPLGNRVEPSDPRLVFYMVDDKYYLAEVWFSGSGAGRKVPVKKEIEFTAKKGGVRRIEVALSR